MRIKKSAVTAGRKDVQNQKEIEKSAKKRRRELHTVQYNAAAQHSKIKYTKRILRSKEKTRNT